MKLKNNWAANNKAINKILGQKLMKMKKIRKSVKVAVKYF